MDIFEFIESKFEDIDKFYLLLKRKNQDKADKSKEEWEELFASFKEQKE